MFYFNPCSYVGSFSDGGMINLNYEEHLKALIDETPDHNKFVADVPDRAHRIESANNDAVKPTARSRGRRHTQDPVGPRLKDRMDTISEIHDSVGYGKALEELIDIGNNYDTSIKARTPFQHSRTR